jgi:D-tyrosyl-tRNA(Tyr) deacylase
MRVLVQRSLKSNVSVDGKTIGSIDKGMVLLVGFTEGDNEAIIDKMVNKIVNLRIFEDDQGKINLSILDVNGSILSISQFTLYANCKEGRRPSFTEALNPTDATKLYDIFNEKLREYVIVETGIFGADMKVEIYNDGPVTIVLDSNELFNK